MLPVEVVWYQEHQWMGCVSIFIFIFKGIFIYVYLYVFIYVQYVILYKYIFIYLLIYGTPPEKRVLSEMLLTFPRFQRDFMGSGFSLSFLGIV